MQILEEKMKKLFLIFQKSRASDTPKHIYNQTRPWKEFQKRNVKRRKKQLNEQP